MEYVINSYFSKQNIKIIKLFITFSLIMSINSISLELKSFSFPYLSVHSNDSFYKFRNLSEQFVYGSAFKINYYYSNLYLGEDMQKQGYILDTGSTITTSTCLPLCNNCGKHISPPYNIKSTDKIISCSNEKCKLVSSRCNSLSNQCSFSISYSEGSSLKGVFINEIVRFGENYKEQNKTYVPIGCTTEENHLFLTQDANGIMGLANNDNNFIDILYNRGAIKKKIFSICLAQLGGVFNIEEINNKIHKENVTFVPMLLDRGKYFGLRIKSMSVNNKTIENYREFGYNIFIDSGTTISYINNKIFDEILSLMKEQCSKFEKQDACGKYSYHSDFGHCFYFTSVEELDYAVYNYWPVIHFYLDGYDYHWWSKNYVFNISQPNKPGACMGINKAFGTKITLGSSWMIGHDIIFDRDNRLIGFAESECYQNKYINFSNGLELPEEEIIKIKNISSTNLKNENLSEIKNNNKNNSTNENKIGNNISITNITIGNNLRFKVINTKIIDIILIICITLLIILIILSIILLFKNCKENKDLGIKTGAKYIAVSTNNINKENNNSLDIV